MRTYIPFLLSLCLLTGCTSAEQKKKPPGNIAGPAKKEESPKGRSSPARIEHYQRLLAKEQCASDAKVEPKAAPSVAPVKLATQRLLVDRIWIPAGYMGDAPEGAVENETCTEDGHRCERWTYTGKGPRRWAAVAYQYLTQGATLNFGDLPGMDLSRKGFSRVVFHAKGKVGGERVLFHSGGHTQAGARYPSSYQATLGMVTLKDRWERYSISLEGHDLSNTTAALVFVVTPQQNPMGCEFFLRDIAFHGTDDQERR